MKKNQMKSLLILVGAMCFGTSGTIQAIAPEGATPFVVGALRMTVGAMTLFLWCLVTKKFKAVQPLSFPHLLLCSLALVGFQLSFFLGVQKVGVAVGTVVAIGFSPLAAAVLALIVFKEYPHKMWYVSTFIAIVGLLLLHADSSSEINWQDMLLPLGAGFSYGCYFVFSKPLTAKNSSELIMMVVCLGSSILLMPVYFLYPVQWVFTVHGILTALGLGVITTAMAFAFVLTGTKYTRVANAVTLALAEPLVATLLGIFFLGEPVTVNMVIGIICILTGVILTGVTQK